MAYLNEDGVLDYDEEDVFATGQGPLLGARAKALQQGSLVVPHAILSIPNSGGGDTIGNASSKHASQVVQILCQTHHPRMAA